MNLYSGALLSGRHVERKEETNADMKTTRAFRRGQLTSRCYNESRTPRSLLVCEGVCRLCYLKDAPTRHGQQNELRLTI